MGESVREQALLDDLSTECAGAGIGVNNRYSDLSLYLKRKLGEDFDVAVSDLPTNKILFSSEESYDKFLEFLIKL